MPVVRRDGSDGGLFVAKLLVCCREMGDGCWGMTLAGVGYVSRSQALSIVTGARTEKAPIAVVRGDMHDF